MPLFRDCLITVPLSFNMAAAWLQPRTAMRDPYIFRSVGETDSTWPDGLSYTWVVAVRRCLEVLQRTVHFISAYGLHSKLDLCEGGSFSPTILKRDIDLKCLPHFVFYICLSVRRFVERFDSISLF